MLRDRIVHASSIAPSDIPSEQVHVLRPKPFDSSLLGGVGRDKLYPLAEINRVVSRVQRNINLGPPSKERLLEKSRHFHLVRHPDRIPGAVAVVPAPAERRSDDGPPALVLIGFIIVILVVISPLNHHLELRLVGALETDAEKLVDGVGLGVIGVLGVENVQLLLVGGRVVCPHGVGGAVSLVEAEGIGAPGVGPPEPAVADLGLVESGDDA